MRKTKTSKFKNFCLWGSIVLLFTAVIGISVHLVRSEPTKTLNATHYSVGTIDTTTGENVDSNLSFRMKNLQTTDGVVIDIKDNPSVTYDIYFYNEDEELVGYQLDLEVDFDSESLMPGYEYFKITITPNQVDGENVVCSIWNILNYTNQVSVTFNK